MRFHDFSTMGEINPSNLKVSVDYTVNDIKKIYDRDWWNHCQGKENPTHALTRGKITSLKD